MIFFRRHPNHLVDVCIRQRQLVVAAAFSLYALLFAPPALHQASVFAAEAQPASETNVEQPQEKSEEAATEEAATEEAATEEAATEEAATEEAATEEAATEETATEETATEEAVTEEAATEEAATEEAATEEAATEEAATEEAATEEAATEEAATEEAATEEAATEEAATEETATEETATEETATEETATEEAVTEEAVTEEAATEEAATEEVATEETAVAEQPATEEEKPAEETAAPAETQPAEATTESPAEALAEAPADPETGRAALKPDEGGHIRFNYVGQPWGEVLQDFADASGYSLDWQELPEGVLNLTTQRQYTVKEARDLLNRHLLARGFTMLAADEVLTIVKVDKIDPSLTPRATPDQLEGFPPHDYMKVTFSIPHSMQPAKAAEDVKILLSPNAKVTPLLASRKLLILDAVINLRDVRDLLNSERKTEETTIKPLEFMLKHRRADYVADQVMIILGLDPKALKTPDELKLESKRLDMQMKMLDKNPKDISKVLKKDGPEVYIAINRRRNSILVNAPDEFMLMIEQTVEQLDVPDEDGSETLMALTLHQYELVSADPMAVITALENNVNLDPRSKLQGDATNRTLLVTATETDHDKIRELITKLDATILPLLDVGELQDAEPTSFVRVRFQLPFSMDPTTLVAKVQPLMSTKATITPLQASRRLLITGSVENLLQVRELLENEELALKSLEDTRNFPIKHLRATEMSQQVLSMLKASPAAISNPKGTLFDVQGMKMFMALNEKQNSLRIGTHPDLIKMIEQIIKQFDIDESTIVDPQAPEQTLVLYKIVGQNVASLTTMLRDLGDISPQTQLLSGPASETLYATATAEQHEKIQKFLDEMRPKKNPRVEADQLEQHDLGEIVQVRFQLPLSLNVSVVSGPIRGFMGPRGVLKMLTTSNQLIIDDEVENLIEIREALQVEMDAIEARNDVREFTMKHLHATDMAQQLLTMLELPPTAVTNPRGVYLYYQGKRFFFAINEQRNSLRIGADPELIKLVEQIIQQFDIEEAASIAGEKGDQSLFLIKINGSQTVQGAITMLNDLGDLNPTTRLQTGPVAQTLYAIATPEEHEKIRKFLKEISPKRNPRIEADQLEQHDLSEIVQVRFQLPLSMNASTVSGPIRGFMGPSGILKIMPTSNQLIIDDTVENLIEVREALQVEMDAIEARNDVREFTMKHLRAKDMAQQVLTMLELPTTSVSNPRGVYLYFQGKRFFFAINEQRNSLRIGADPELIKLVEQIIQQFDIKEVATITGETGDQSIAHFKVEGQSVEGVIAMLRDLGDLDPLTRLQSGPVPQTLFAIATQEEHEKIRQFLDKIAPVKIPRVAPDKIEDYPPGDLIRVIFQLPLEANIAEAAAQITGILTPPDGKVQPLASSKQLIVTEKAAKMLEIRDILQAEEAALKTQEIIHVYALEHRRAEEMVGQVLTMLGGIDPETITNPAELRTELRLLKVFVTANPQRNSIVVNASEEKQKKVAEIIKQLDVPQDESVVTDASKQTMVPYKVTGRYVLSLVEAIEAIDGLDPRTKVTGDPYNYSLYVYATKADHEEIRQVIEKMTSDTVQRVEADKLEDYSPNEVVRVRFQLPLSADANLVSAQIRGILSPTGKVQVLTSSRQVIVSDTVTNLIDVRDILLSEKQAQEAQEQIHEFVLEHAHADQMAKQVLVLLGLPPTAVTNPEGAHFTLRGMRLFLSVKQQRNALLIRTHPELLEVIKPIIKRFDVPDSANDIDASQTMVLYKVTGQNVTSVIQMLEDLGDLSPQVRLKAGPATETLYAIAGPEDHKKISKFLEKIAPTQIQNLDADKLEEYPSHEMARVLFQLSLTADVTKSAAQIKGVVVLPGRVQPLELSKQLMVTEKVANLIEIREILRAEEEAYEAQDNIREFTLQHRRAEEMLKEVLNMLGFNSEAMSPYQMRTELQTMKLFISANDQRNSLLVNAPAERMEIVEEIIKQLDVPEMQVGEGGAEALTMLPYKVEKQDPTSVINTLQEVGGLSPLVRLQADPVSHTIYAYANEKDHEIIREFLDKTAPESILRVAPEELEQHPMRDLARVRFELPMATDIHQANTQIRGIISSEGNVQMLASSRQLIVDDTVANLIDIRDILKAEAAALETAKDIREFTIVHRRADEMYTQVLTMLGLEPESMNAYQMRLALQELKLFISTNEQRNSLIVNAPVDKMIKVEQILKQLDVPQEEPRNGEAGGLTMVPYKVATTQNVVSVLDALMEIGNLGPRTRLQSDVPSKTLFAYATEADHEKIQQFIEKTDPNFVLGVEAEELEEYPATKILRVRFQLPKTADMLLATTQVKGILGLSAKVQSLEASKQLIVVDTATNLIEIREVLKAEKMALESQNNIREFRLQHRRANEMYTQVLTMMGLEPESMNPYQMRLALQELKIFISANDQRNSLMVNAPPEKMHTVEQLVKQLDVPEEGLGEGETEGLTMVPYKVDTTQNVVSVVTALMEIGNLGPRTRLQSDVPSKTLYAYATEADHKKIQQFIEKSDPNFVLGVEAEELEEYPATKILRVRFQLPQTADMLLATTQVKGILGLSAKVQALEASKQLIVVDTATNLIEIREVLKAEKMALESQNNIREFRLEHRRADEMYTQVLTMMGLEPESMNPYQMRLALQELKIFISANDQRNSLMVNAPPEKMHTVEQLVKQLDVPKNDTDNPSGRLPANDPNRQTMVPYKLFAQNVDMAIKALEEIGNLEPRTRLQGDLTSKTLYAYASKKDHEKIRQFVDDLDPNQVRRVHPDELEDYPSHDIVRVLFQLPLTADVLTSEEQIKGILGLESRVQSLESSKQLVVVDTVSNLIDVRDVLYAEEMAAEAHEMPRVFPLQYRRATYVVEQVLILLGLDPTARKTTSELEFEARRMMMQQQQQGGRRTSKLGTQDINIAVNRRQNSLLVNCPPEKMPLIERAIEHIDVPSGEERPVDPGPVTMEKYQMASESAEGVIRALDEIGNLDPRSQMQSDSTGKAIYAFATPTDHKTIKKMIDKLDGSGRRTEVRWLPTRLPADQVAGSIQALIVGPEKKKPERPWYYSYRYGNDEEEDTSGEFRIIPDVENNRLLLWANDVELEEVDKLIEKLSDNSNSAFADRRKVRRIEARDPEATLKLLERLQSTWSGDNKLEIETIPPKPEPKIEQEPDEEQKPEEEDKPKDDKLTSADPRFMPRYWYLAQVVAESVEEEKKSAATKAQPDANSNQTQAPAPIKITINDKGEIIISSEDTVALDELESLIEHLAPLQTEFHSFELHYIHVLDVVYNLEVYFEDELAEEEGQSFRDWYGRMQDTKPKEAPISLGKRPPMRFIDDIGTNTLIVANATTNQLKVIKDIIDLYDRPANPDLYLHRKTEAIKIQYSRATDIANTLKDVYRDLLSTKDKEFQDKEGKQSFGSISADKPYVFGDATATRNGREGPVLVRFSGALSVGVDEVSNSVIVSARKEVLEEVKQTISQLDKAAKDESVVRVHLAKGILNAEDLEGIINEALTEPWLGGKPGANSSRNRSRSSRSRRNRSPNGN